MLKVHQRLVALIGDQPLMIQEQVHQLDQQQSKIENLN
jgi:hypothetical protein